MKQAARIYYRMVRSGIRLEVAGDNLVVNADQPLSEAQRQAVRDHKPALIDLADWYQGDGAIIRILTEEQFIALAEDYFGRRELYRGSGERHA